MKSKFVSVALSALVVLLGGSLANAQEMVPIGQVPVVQQVQPQPSAGPGYGLGTMRITPYFGSGTFGTGSSDSIGDSTSIGMWFDIGRSYLTFQTGFSYDNNTVEVAGRDANLNTWGVPMTMKINFSGQPNKTIYAKGGVNFITEANDLFTYTDTVGILGAGATIPLGSERTALLLEADYAALLTREIVGEELSGWKFFGGISFSL